jgi:hypothetical protein
MQHLIDIGTRQIADGTTVATWVCCSMISETQI